MTDQSSMGKRPKIPENYLYLANVEYQNIKPFCDKKLQNLSNLTTDKFNEYEINFVNSMTNCSQVEKRIYINTFAKPRSYFNFGSTDIEKEIKINKELKNNILKDANIQTHAIIDNYFNIIIINASGDEYVNFYKTLNFCLVFLNIKPN